MYSCGVRSSVTGQRVQGAKCQLSPFCSAELQEYLPHNAVEFFVSHFSLYRPEAYLSGKPHISVPILIV